VEMVDKNPSIVESNLPEMTEEQRAYMYTYPKVTKEYVSDYLLNVRHHSKLPVLNTLCENVVTRLSSSTMINIFDDRRLFVWSSFLRSVPSDEFEKLYVSYIIQFEFGLLMEKQPEPRGFPREYLGPAFESINSLMKKDTKAEAAAKHLWKHFSNIGRIITSCLKFILAEQSLSSIVSMFNFIFDGERKAVAENFFFDQTRTLIDIILLVIRERPDELTSQIASIIHNVVGDIPSYPLGQYIMKSLKPGKKAARVCALFADAKSCSAKTTGARISHYDEQGLSKEEFEEYNRGWYAIYLEYRDEIREAIKYSDELKQLAIVGENTFREQQKQQQASYMHWMGM